VNLDKNLQHNLSEGDKLDISDLIDYQASNNLADFVSVENIGHSAS
jgi:hypothetical protein